MATFAIGNIGEFNELMETWKSYMARVKQYYTANEIPKDKTVPALLAMMGGKTYSLLQNLMTPDDRATKGYDDIVKLLDDHLSPKPLVIVERFCFHKRDQNEEDLIPVYVAELRKLLEHCDFKANLSEALRDRLVCGVKKENIQKRLLSESDLKVEKAIEIATAMEAALEILLSFSTNTDRILCINLARDRVFLLSQRRTIRHVFTVLGLIIYQISVTLRNKPVDFAPKRDTSRELV